MKNLKILKFSTCSTRNTSIIIIRKPFTNWTLRTRNTESKSRQNNAAQTHNIFPRRFAYVLTQKKTHITPEKRENNRKENLAERRGKRIADIYQTGVAEMEFGFQTRSITELWVVAGFVLQFASEALDINQIIG